jgi:hypothetical protein
VQEKPSSVTDKVPIEKINAVMFVVISTIRVEVMVVEYPDTLVIMHKTT